MFLKQLRHHQSNAIRAAFVLFTALYASGSHAQTDLIFGVYTADKPTMMVKAYRPVLSALEKELADRLQDSVSIRVQVSSSYQKGIDALATGEVDFAMLGPASYIEAINKQPNLKILALESKDGSKTFNGVICVREDSKINNLAELTNTRFAFGNQRSTIGRYLSQSLLTRNGITAQDLLSFDYLERHDLVAQSVAQGNHEAGALKEGTYIKLKQKGYKLRSLTTIPLINRPWVASAGVNSKLYVALKESMLNLNAPEAFKAMGRKQFVRGSDYDFAEIRAAIKGNAAFFTTNWHAIATTEE